MSSAYKRIKSFIISIILFLISLFIIVCFTIGIKNLCSIFQIYETPISRINIKEKKVALTFDVAWGSENIEEILNLLDKYNSKATFFLVGSWIDNNEELVRKIHSKGHEIGNHSNTHRSFVDISNEDKVEEIVSTSKKIENLTGEKVNIFRPPFGKVDKDTMNTCKSLGYYTIKWDVDSGDWKNIGISNIVDRVSKNTSSGSIILFHANTKNISIYLESVLNNLENKNYSMVTISNIIYKNNYKVNSYGQQSSQDID